MNQPSQIRTGDFVGVRMITATDVGYPDSEEHLAEILHSFNLRGIVVTLARINLLLQRSEDLLECEKILRNAFCSHILRTEIDRCALTECIVFNRQSTLYLLNKIVAMSDSCSTSTPESTVDVRHELGRCYLIANQLVEEESLDSWEGLPTERRSRSPAGLIPCFEYAIHVSPSPWPRIRKSVVRSADFLARLRNKARTFVVDDTFYQATGLTLQDYQCLIFGMISMILSHSQEDVLKGYVGIIDIKSPQSLAPLYQKLLKFDGISIDNLSSVLSVEMASSLPNEFRLWRKYPLLRISDDKIICIDVGFLADKLETGAFWIICNKLNNETYGKGADIIGLSGEIFEEYAASIIKHGIKAQTLPNPETCVVSPKFNQKEEKECTDIAVKGRETLILLECKAPLLSAKTKFGNNPLEFHAGIERSVIKGIRQLCNAIHILCNRNESEKQTLRDMDISGVKKIYPVLVLAEPTFTFPTMSGFLNSEFQRFIKENPEKKELEIMPLTVMTIDEIEDLEPYLCDTPFFAHLDRWLAVFKRNESYPFSEYLRSLIEGNPRENRCIDQEFSRLHENIMEYITRHGIVDESTTDERE